MNLDDHRTLVLDKSYKPIGFLNWQEAIKLWFSGRAEVLEAYGIEIHSMKESYKLPAVLIVNMILKRKEMGLSRISLLARDKGECSYCGKHLNEKTLTLDHIIPVSRGGKKTWENIVAACFPCNSKKGNRTPIEAGMALKNLPQKPKFNPLFVMKMNSVEVVAEIWKPYLEIKGL